MSRGGPAPSPGLPTACGELTVAGLHESLVAALPPSSKKAPILDLGCGTGAWLERLARLGYRDLWGLDQRSDPGRSQVAHWIKGDLDAREWRLPRDDFELMTAIEVLEHLENRGAFFDNVARHLAPGGFFLLTTPNIHSNAARVRFLLTGKLAQFDEKGDPTHLQPVLLEGLRRSLPRHGLTLVRTWGYPERGTRVYRRGTVLAATLLSPLAPEPVPGDIMCVLGRKQGPT